MTNRISALRSVSFGWLHEHGGFEFGEPFFLDPRVRLEREQAMHAFVAQRFPHDPIYSIEAHLVQIEGRLRPVALVGGIQPNLILGAAVGAQLVFARDKDPDMTPAPLAELRSVDRLSEIDWPNTWPVSLFLDQIHTVREAFGDRYSVVPPFFWDTTGRATTHGIITTAQKLMGERIFLEMTDSPELAHEFFRWIVDAYVKLIKLFADAAALEITGLHTGDCSVCMIAPDQFAEFVLPHLNEFSGRLGALRLHSCGMSDHLLDVFRGVENLASFNVGGNTSVAKIRERFGPVRIDLIPDTQLLTVGTPDDVDAWVRRCVEENGDGELEFQYHLDLGQPEATCRQIHRTLGARGISSPRVEIH